MKKLINILKSFTMPIMAITLTSLVLVCTAFITSLITVEQTVLVLFFNMTVLAFHMLVILVLDLFIAINERPKAKAKIRMSNKAMNELWKESAKNGWAEVRELKKKVKELENIHCELEQKNSELEEKVGLLKTAVKIAEQELHDVKHDIKLSVNTNVSDRINSEGDYDVEPTWKGDLELILLTLENEIGLNTGTNYLVRSLEEQIADIDFANTNESELIAITCIKA